VYVRAQKESYYQFSAIGAVRFLTDTALFVGQSAELFAVLTALAREADAARNEGNQDRDDEGKEGRGRD
jgi:hypothetical protein